eukprot:Hpha_TRINITY_DN25257_c0_g1::TRINITY_DN25257_c0_g1_i1::g.110786::m.110786
MDWLAWGLQLLGVFVLFLLTGAPVTPNLSSWSINSYDAKSNSYFTWLVLHYFIGAAFVGFLLVGVLRNLFFDGDAKQAARVWSIVFLLAGAFTVFGTFGGMMPGPNSADAPAPVADSPGDSGSP